MDKRSRSDGKEARVLNVVHQNSIWVETVNKEHRHQKLHTQFNINPFQKMHSLTGKVNSFADATEGDEDPRFQEVIKRANTVPVQKYTEAQTSSQEIGWITQPLTDVDRTDPRLYFPHQSSSITTSVIN